MLRLSHSFIAAALVLLLASPFAGAAETAATPDTAVVGTLHVAQHGEHGTAVILLPGLGSGAWVWQDTIDRLESSHRLYAVTLAGFDGTPAPAQMDNLIPQAIDSLQELMRQRGIDKAVLVGHSLGGTLAIAFAAEHPDRVTGVVAVDGLPVFPGMEDMPAAQRVQAGDAMATAMRSASPEAFRAQQFAYMERVGVLDAAKAQRYGALQARSLPAVVAQYAREDVSLDLRPRLARIKAPLLEIMPWNGPDAEAAAAAGVMPAMDEAGKRAWYARLLQAAPRAEVLAISPARHFVMLDQPQQFVQAVETFLAGVEKAK